VAALGSNLPPRPTALPVEPDGIPDELKDLKQFVGWRYEPLDRDWTKVPYTVDDQGRLTHASTTNRSTWLGFDGALVVATVHELDGIGFVFSPDDPYVGVDLDHCFTNDGMPSAFAQRMTTSSQRTKCGRSVTSEVRPG
jgi:putative DNA primase/helicase